MSVIKTYRKAAVERRRLHLDYSRWLETTETLTDFQVTVTPVETASPVVVNVSYPDLAHKSLVMFASGGIATKNYNLQLVVRTNEGQVKRDDIGLRVNP